MQVWQPSDRDCGPDEDTVRDSSCWLSSSCVFLLYLRPLFNLLLFSLAAVFVFCLFLCLVPGTQLSSSLSPASFLDFSSFPPFLLYSPFRPIHYSSPSFSVSLSRLISLIPFFIPFSIFLSSPLPSLIFSPPFLPFLHLFSSSSHLSETPCRDYLRFCFFALASC